MALNSTTIITFNLSDYFFVYQNRDYVLADNENDYDDDDDSRLDVVIVKAMIIIGVMSAAVVGNTLVIVSVWRFDKLRIMANAFIVSLAFADLLVALLVMPFSASQEIAGRWLFGRITCDVFNANDVLFSTASLLHLCCISMDRYIAITDPFGYADRMTRRRAAITLGCAWTASALVSHVPIHLGLYATQSQQDSDQECSFRVNRFYGIVSSTVSFWTPTTVMVFTYVKIYREARKQEKQIAAATYPVGGRRTPLPDGPSSQFHDSEAAERTSHEQRLTQEKRQMRREHKAAKTLGMIMGAFLVCWLPFFTWYLTSSLCQESCATPSVYISALFWIGYANSALNPVIYACFNRDFRYAFKKLLGYDRRLGFCCSGEMANTERTCLKTNSTELDNLSPNHQIH